MSGRPANIALSVVLAALLYTTNDFNGLQMLVESGKFDLPEPLIFHMIRRNIAEWSLVAVDPIGAAMLIHKGSDVDDPNSFILLKTLLRSSSLNLEMPISAMEIWPHLQRPYEWSAFRSDGALSFIEWCYSSSFFSLKQLSSGKNYEEDGDQQNKRILSLLQALCRMDLFLMPHMRPTVCFRQLLNVLPETEMLSKPFLSVLMCMFRRGSGDLHR